MLDSVLSRRSDEVVDLPKVDLFRWAASHLSRHRELGRAGLTVRCDLRRIA
jgi:hypothetical protein